MARGRRLGVTTLTTLQAVANGYRYGFDIMDATGLPSGTVYPALGRLERDGLVRAEWEDGETAHREGRPQRRYYEITEAGVGALEAGFERLDALRRFAAGAVAGSGSAEPDS